MTSPIWYKEYTLETLQSDIDVANQGRNILASLGIEITDIKADALIGTMPSDERTHQIYGILHGGATCVLAETIGSVAAIMCIDATEYTAVGSMITANHLRPTASGLVTATAKPVHLGKTKHVWDIPVTNEQGKLVAKCELTCAIIPKPKKA
jgi:1,4-dihydroxy-2-naphthoyl-CoA hydrolase